MEKQLMYGYRRWAQQRAGQRLEQATVQGRGSPTRVRKQRGRTFTLSMILMLGATFAAAAADCTSAAQAEIDWRGCNRRNLDLSGSNLERAQVQEADLSSTDLRSTSLAGANFEKVKLVRASLAGAVADKTSFVRVEGYRTNFTGISAKGASFQSAELQRADFTDAALAGADFEKAELGRARFKGANLANNKFAFANLARADLSEAKIGGPMDFTNAYMFLTRIAGADLSGATGLTQAQIDLTCGDDKTKLPGGLTPATNWPCGSD
jgi:uncharacterized protein YjbI with pentapeptide repeats